MTTTNLATPQRALAVGAHPDDIEFGCGGTLAKWALDGCEITHVVCTDGSKGSWSNDTDRDELVRVRETEQRNASIALGGHGNVLFLGWPDGELENGPEQRRQLATWIRRFHPDVVLGHDPWRRYRLHPDHRHAGFLVTDSIVAARDPLFFPDLGIEPHRPSTLLLFEADEVDHLEDVASTFSQRVDALLCHRSQFESTMHIQDGSSGGDIDAEEITRFVERERDDLADRGAPVGFALGESFKRIEKL